MNLWLKVSFVNIALDSTEVEFTDRGEKQILLGKLLSGTYFLNQLSLISLYFWLVKGG